MFLEVRGGNMEQRKQGGNFQVRRVFTDPKLNKLLRVTELIEYIGRRVSTTQWLLHI